MKRSYLQLSLYIALWAMASNAVAQTPAKFGVLTKAEKEFTAYEKDTTAAAVYLYESGNNYFDVINDRIWLVTKYHAKIKILKQEGLDHANIEIPYYHNDSDTEKVLNIKAYTHNNGIIAAVQKEEVFEVDETERWSTKRFAMPNVQVGSIIEYAYEVQSPFYFNLNGWEFQEDIPKLYTEYNAKIPGNWLYNRSLVGSLKLDVNEASIKKNCFSVPGISAEAACEVLQYAMRDVPAFKDKEAFMLAGTNYRSRLKFELSEYRSFYGGTKKYTKNWKSVDTEFKTDKDIGRQLRKKNFFENNVPTTLLTEGDTLTRAKNIYEFVKNHFKWNEKYGIWRNNRVKKAFEEKVGNVAEINITLINLLNAAGIETDLMLAATRSLALPKLSHPVMTDFNYILAKTDIAGKTYLLDATDKYTPFGMLPFRCLNYYGRVMDFDAESYWENIVPEPQNARSIMAQISFDIEAGMATGNFIEASSGYEGMTTRRKLETMTEEEYALAKEQEFGSDFYITSHEVNAEKSTEKRVIQKFEFELENIADGPQLFINPFLKKFFTSNPFKSEERNFPIDFGYPRNYRYSITIPIPQGYRVKDLPENVGLQLPETSGVLRFKCAENNGTISVFFNFTINGTQFAAEGYPYVRTIFSKMVQLQNQTYIVLEKI